MTGRHEAHAIRVLLYIVLSLCLPTYVTLVYLLMYRNQPVTAELLLQVLLVLQSPEILKVRDPDYATRGIPSGTGPVTVPKRRGSDPEGSALKWEGPWDLPLVGGSSR